MTTNESMDDGRETANYDVGYGKPPPETQFKPGQSGNPKGRPKGSRNLKTDLQDELNERIIIKENKIPIKLSKQRVIVKSLVTSALNGDHKAMAKALDLMLRLSGMDNEEERSAEEVSVEDEAVIARYLERNLGEKA